MATIERTSENAHSTRSRTLRSRIVFAFAGFALAVAAIFGLSAAVFLYAVEDTFFDATLSEEAALREQNRIATQQWGTPGQAWMTVYDSALAMPIDLRSQLAADPGRREFAGDSGRHYHVRKLSSSSSGTPQASAWLVAEVSQRLVVRPLRGELLRKWLVVELLMLVVAIAIALWVARRIARPLSSLAETLHHFDPLTTTVPVAQFERDREISSVAGALESMQTRVRQFLAREQAFTRDASHELRTPLSVIRSATAQVQHDPALTEASRRMLSLSMQSAEHMERTIASLLSLTRETFPDNEITWQPVLPVIERVVLEQSVALDRNDLALEIDVSPDARSTADETVLHLLISNLLGNAIAHAAPGPIRVTVAGGCLHISNSIIPGSAPETAMLGVPGVKREDSPGFGYGLSIVQRLAARAGLSIECQTRDGVFLASLGLAPRP